MLSEEQKLRETAEALRYMETFITKVKVNQSRRVSNLDIPLSATCRQHLIITGKNGSGKTSLLEEIKKFLSQIEHGNYQHYLNQTRDLINDENRLNAIMDTNQKLQTEKRIDDYRDWLKQFGGVELTFSNHEIEVHNKFLKGEFLLAYFDAKRFVKLNIPKGINKVELKPKYGLDETINNNFIQYIVNLKADRSFARDEGEENDAKAIDKWFERFENQLKTIFDDKSLKLHFDRKSYNFSIRIDNCEPFGFNTLSDGYSAIISIVTELLLRMEAHHEKAYDLEGVVLIDEIETHLHVDLQKRVLPFLTDFFPKIQFIVTTHSPFVLSSVSNATICNLETRTVTTDLSAYSYDALLESYFMSDKYSAIIKDKIAEYEALSIKPQRTEEEEKQIRLLWDYFAHAPKYLSKELFVKLQQIELNTLCK
jgi:predicted ATP-binding protein involved in virulence